MTARTITVALALLVAPARGSAADPPPEDAAPAPAYEATVTGLRLARPRRDVPATTLVLPREEIARAAGVTADALVRSLPSVATFRRSSSLAADPSSQSSNLRGIGPSGASRALVLLDGVPVNDPFGGWVYWRSLPALAIDRVEVTPSGASALYGNLALGGVMQVVSRPIAPGGVELEASGGSSRLLHGAARGAHVAGPAAVELVVEGLDSGGWSPVSAAQRGAVDGPAGSAHASARARLELRPVPRLEVRVHGRAFDESLDAGTAHTSASARVLQGGAGARLATAAGDLALELFAGTHRFEQRRARVAADRATAAPAAEQRVPATSEGAALTFTTAPLRAAGEHVLLLGVDLQRVRGTSRERLFPATAAPAAVISRDAGGAQRFAGAFVQDAVRLAPWLEAAAALRVDRWWSVDGAQTTRTAGGEVRTDRFAARASTEVSPRVGLLARAGPVSLRGSVYRAFRAPTLNELYRPFQVGTVVTAANEELRAEALRGVEAGPELVLGTLTARATGFWNVLDRPIQNVTLSTPLPGGATRRRQNLGAARVRGVELEAGWRPSRRVTALAAYTYVEPVVTSAPGQEGLVGRDLPQDPRHRATATLAFDDRRLLSAAAQLRVTGRQFEDDRNELPLGAAAVVDLSLARELTRGFAAFVAAENLLDRRYLVGRAGVDTVGQPLTVRAGLRWRGVGPR